MAELANNCRCGKVRLSVDVPSRRAGTRVVCYCKDCQAASHSLDAAELLTAPGGTDIWQTTPDRLSIEAGAEHLRILRLSPNGLFRWYAGCCDTPLFNTLPRLGLPFVGVVLSDRDAAGAAIGPVYGHAHTSMARPGKGAPANDKNFYGTGWGVVSRMIVASLSGRGKITPLRTSEGGPIAPIRVLTLEERRAATP